MQHRMLLVSPNVEMEALLGNPKVMKHEKEGKLEHMYAVCAVQGKCNMFALKWDDSVK